MDGECVIFKVMRRWVVVNCKLWNFKFIGDKLRGVFKEVLYLICFFMIFFKLFEDIVVLLGIFIEEEIL